ncbi:hypothetical protein M271_38775 [Streptomyces rapamycinicus NRRL 5491]|uniref:Uncharacterized protein n=1 Tax=Streptomyces rapamycinicus TaxID=1226757 RepID=A0ABR6LZR8_9ACTN|nr:hypothetical protein M271_38775 [Streptomyces rapamycinicus NRRL 5491]MBB4786874.1 hypothetical protein [Streptomyces rapamycinicus]
MGLPGAGVADQTERLSRFDPGRVGQGADKFRRDIRILLEVEILQALGPGEAGVPDQPLLAPFLAFGALGLQQVGKEVLVAGPLAHRRAGHLLDPTADRRQVQGPACLVDGRVHGLLRTHVAAG